MKKILSTITVILFTIAATAQTLNVQVGTALYQFPASQTGAMLYSGGTAVKIMGKTFTLSDISSMYTDEASVTDNEVSIVYSSGGTASVNIAGNVARYVTPTVSGNHVTIAQSSDVDDTVGEITYKLSGTATDGSLTLSGSYKSTIALAGVTLTNPSGAAITVTNSKRIQISAKEGTTNTLTDGASGSQKACIYSKGQLQLQGNGTLNVVGKTAHGIKSASYISIKNLTLNITSTVGDGLNCEEYFQMKSGTVTISGVGDDGIQCDYGDATALTGETTDHEDEDTGNMYFEGGTLNITTTATGAKAIKAEGGITFSGGTITAVSSGSNDTSNRNDPSYAKAIKCDGDITISGGTITAKSSNHEGIETKGVFTMTGGTVYAYAKDDAINSASTMTISGGVVMAQSTGNDGIDANGNLYIKGGVVYAICTGSNNAEVAIDANTEGGYKLYIQGGTIIALGGLERGSQLSQTCYQTSSWNKSTWYSMTVGSETIAVKTPSSGGSTMVVSGASTPTLKSGVTVSGGTACCDSQLYTGATVSGGSTVSLSSYSDNSGGGPGGGGGGPGGGGHW